MEEEKKVEETLEKKENEMKEEKKEPIKINVAFAAIVIVLIMVAIFLIVFAIGTSINKRSNGQVNNVTGEIRKTDLKPIIYLYPTEKTELTVKLGYPEKLLCSYPKYEELWKVTANPDGTLVDNKTGKSLYSLYWEGDGSPIANLKEGFVVSGEDSARFLEEKLEILGLNYKEAEEFIVYWLPKLEANKYNYIRFASMEEIEEYMPLEFSVKPDSIIRILMQFKGLEEKIDVEEQKLETPKREGFVAVEWGGTELD